MRGATIDPHDIRLCPSISIHTPHAGSDIKLYLVFNYLWISIHTPHAGSDDFTACRYYDKVAISIHTPHAGSDSYTRGEYYGYQDFNPHSPCGERPSARHPSGQLCGNFNPHSPCGERRATMYNQFITGTFQSTLPMRGATMPILGNTCKIPISIHTPHAGSDYFFRTKHPVIIFISIHTPHAGSDSSIVIPPLLALEFQSTLPMRGATLKAA